MYQGQLAVLVACQFIVSGYEEGGGQIVPIRGSDRPEPPLHHRRGGFIYVSRL